MISAPFCSGKKICHSNVATADAMREAFMRSEDAFMENWGPKVTQLLGGEGDWMKAASVTDPIPTRPRPTRQRHPDPP